MVYRGTQQTVYLENGEWIMNTSIELSKQELIAILALIGSSRSFEVDSAVQDSTSITDKDKKEYKCDMCNLYKKLKKVYEKFIPEIVSVYRFNYMYIGKLVISDYFYEKGKFNASPSDAILFTERKAIKKINGTHVYLLEDLLPEGQNYD